MPAHTALHADLIAHCDWGSSPDKRWMVTASLCGERHNADGPERVDSPSDLISSLRERVPTGSSILLGCDFPIGLPKSYLLPRWKGDFLDLLPLLGQVEPWHHFYEVATTADEIGTCRPFYPRRPGGTKQKHLLDRLACNCLDHIRRRCDLKQEHRRAACPIFWTLGAQQVGRAAISGWREVVAPALAGDPRHIFVWPFSGTLDECLQSGAVVIAETYPAEYYRHLGIRFGPGIGGKGSEQARLANAPALLSAVADLDVVLCDRLKTAVERGFPPACGGDDGFDALVGLLGMVKVVRRELPGGTPEDDSVRRLEGWMLGQEY